ncbi:hypothetical protein I553_0611 [Mycobacterium xenopi 4042]|uniref:Uncharacterized protein n=1 Tax=Mycobacterium xenopi 4042 TaxID=1299334 RepID=X7YJ21_MYCXE|nr:hypothetical protein I553_0611 [Mycobacterium xenopi 4042]
MAAAITTGNRRTSRLFRAGRQPPAAAQPRSARSSRSAVPTAAPAQRPSCLWCRADSSPTLPAEWPTPYAAPNPGKSAVDD